ncbi:hypothetical protein, partial [Klebsiella pneumoniae]|uniref:hypothetical protein n=1 Tax=Klebsiella pneumoniae TaxID=573 RepID=UPI0039C2141B
AQSEIWYQALLDARPDWLPFCRTRFWARSKRAALLPPLLLPLHRLLRLLPPPRLLALKTRSLLQLLVSWLKRTVST